MSSLAAAVITLFVTILGFPASATAADTLCIGAITGALGNVIVPNGASCTLSNAVVGGNVQVAQGASLSVTGPGGSKIGGNVQADYCQSVLLTGSVAVQGNVQIQHCAATSGYIGPGIQIGGSFHCQNNQGSCVADEGKVGGNLQIQNNSSPIAADVSLSEVDPGFGTGGLIGVVAVPSC